jgi:hypothetical protein
MRTTILLAGAAAVLTVACGAAAIGLTPAATAQTGPPVIGTLTMTPPEGTHETAPRVRTSGGCPEDSDGYNMYVYGPGGFADGALITSTTDAGFSRTDPFEIFFANNMRDTATDLGTTLQAGEYPIVAQCVDTFFGDVKATFTMSMWFTSPTEYQTTDPNAPTTTTTPPPTSSTTTTTTTATTPNGPGEEIGITIPSLSTSHTPAPTTPRPGGGLAQTGAELRWAFILGFLLLAAGLSLVMTADNRRVS